DAVCEPVGLGERGTVLLQLHVEVAAIDTENCVTGGAGNTADFLQQRFGVFESHQATSCIITGLCRRVPLPSLGRTSTPFSWTWTGLCSTSPSTITSGSSSCRPDTLN